MHQSLYILEQTTNLAYDSILIYIAVSIHSSIRTLSQKRTIMFRGSMMLILEFSGVSTRQLSLVLCKRVIRSLLFRVGVVAAVIPILSELCMWSRTMTR
jgi:hypothetical protein